MCESLADGGRRCASHQVGTLAAKKMSALDCALPEKQVDELFSALLAEGRDMPAPTQAQYARFIRAHKKKLGAVAFQTRAGEADRRRIGANLDRELSDSELPSGAAFYAMRKLHARARDQKKELTALFKSIARDSGTTIKSVREEYMRSFDSFELPDGVEGGGALSARSVALLDSIRERGTGGQARTASVPKFSPEPRVVHQPIEGSSFLNSVGWDSDDGRLEVNIQGTIYAYRGVSREDYERLLEEKGRFFSKIRKNPEYQYASREEAARDAFGRWCEDCHKYKAISGHLCDFSAAEARARGQLDALQEVSAESLSEDQKRRFKEAVERLKERLGELPPEPREDDPSVVEARTRRESKGVFVASSTPSLRERRWAVPVAERETVELPETESLAYVTSTGLWRPRFHRYNTSYPRLDSSPADIKKTIVTQGKVARYTASRHAGGVNLQADMESWIQDGQAHHKVRSLKCNCEDYAQKYYCVHTLSNNPSRRGYAGTISLNRSQVEELGLMGSPLITQGYHSDYFELRISSDGGSLDNIPDELGRRITDLRAKYYEEYVTSGLASHLGLSRVSTVNSEENVIPGRIHGNKLFLSPNGVISKGLKASSKKALVEALGRGGTVLARFPSATHFGSNERNGLYREELTYFDFKAKLSVVNGEIQVELPGSHGDRERSLLEAHVHNMVTGNGFEASNFEALRETEEFEQAKQDYVATQSIEARRREWAETVEETQATQKMVREIAEVEEERREIAPGLLAGVEDAGVKGFSNNLDSYIDEVRRARRDSSGLEFKPEGGVTGGLCTPESGVGFGLELEYEVPSGVNKETAIRAIARDMQEAGLSDIENPTGYHGYSGSRWHVERDATVHGEVVSPVLHDTPEHWEEVRKVTEIIKRHGGKVTLNTGGHVHMGVPSGNRAKPAISQVVARHHDSIRRMQASFKRKEHRNSRWAKAVSTAELYQHDSDFSGSSDPWVRSNHGTDTNFGHSGRMEFRGFDGSLDVAELQKNVAVAAGVVRLAEKNLESGGKEIGFYEKVHSKTGTGREILSAIGASSSLPETDDELIVADRDFRSFIDAILPGDWGRKVGVAVAARVPWQKKGEQRR